MAICFGKHVFTAEASLSEHTLAHEYCHVLQYRRHGFIGYLVRWFYWTWKVGYVQNPLELEACAYADRVVPRVYKPFEYDWSGLRWREGEL